LRDRYKNSGFRAVDEEVDEERYTRGRSCRQEDVIGVGRIPVSFFVAFIRRQKMDRSGRDAPWMNLATFLRIKGTP